jgi:hypothetical protein
MYGNTLEERASEMKARMQQGRKAEKGSYLNASKRESVVWTKGQVMRIMGPLVYIFWQWDIDEKTMKPLYVGRSSFGLARPLSPGHHLSEVRDGAKGMEIIFCASEKDSVSLEKLLIRRLKPEHNTRAEDRKYRRGIYADMRPRIED